MDEKEKTIILELDDESAPIVRTLIDKESSLREELINFLTPGKVTKMPMQLFVYVLIYILDNYSNDKVNIKYCVDDPDAEKPKYSVVVTIDYADLDKGELLYVPNDKNHITEKENN